MISQPPSLRSPKLLYPLPGGGAATSSPPAQSLPSGWGRGAGWGRNKAIGGPGISAGLAPVTLPNHGIGLNIVVSKGQVEMPEAPEPSSLQHTGGQELPRLLSFPAPPRAPLWSVLIPVVLLPLLTSLRLG